MSKKIYYTEGQKVNNLIFIKELPERKNHRYARWECYCGKMFDAYTLHVRSGNTKSCGCYQIEQLTTHGLTKHKLYSVWGSMKDRCLNSNDNAFKYYGVRGVTICNEWINDFKNFYDWAMANGYKKGLSIERINNDGNYCPENCTFATSVDQSHNRRSTKLDWRKVGKIRKIKQNNPQMLQREIADIYGVDRSTIGHIFGNKIWTI